MAVMDMWHRFVGLFSKRVPDEAESDHRRYAPDERRRKRDEELASAKWAPEPGLRTGPP